MLSSGDVVALDLGVPEGHEAGFAHPAIIVTAQRILDAGPTVVHVVPLTSRLRGYHSEVRIDADDGNGLDRDSSAQCQHLRAVSSQRIGQARGNVGASALAQLRETIALILDLPG
jgi:mRNA interferase MazF